MAPTGRGDQQGVHPQGRRQRPLGIAALEDKIVQRAVVEVLNAVYEEHSRFLDGFTLPRRPPCSMRQWSASNGRR